MTVETPETPVPERACPSCGSAMAAAQDWCLECGNATPGRLSSRAGRNGIRAATTIVSAVLLLVGGAVAASYAALNSKAQEAATAPAPPSAVPQVASTPPTTTVAPPPTTPPATTSAATPPPAPTPTTTAAPAPAPTPTPAPPTPTPTTPTPPQPTGNQPLDLGVDVASVYDPDGNAVDQTDPADSYDQNPKTVFTFTTADPAKDMGVGLDFDLEADKKVEKVYFRTTTPGATVEIYGTKGKQPPDILDTRWHPLGTRHFAGTAKHANGLVKIVFAAGEYRHILLWFTKPPPAGPTVGISEVRILD
ncbi:MAG: hypothetical protein QOG68_2655 [Solirubrobacteraceae bacterium]|nr:hypothetical protein [Solirubrobacteraceae bacterium]